MSHPHPSEHLAREHLARVLASSPFVRSHRIRDFLRHVVEAKLAGRPEDAKEAWIGVAVFARPIDYDPKTDPIVRVEARRLREKLDEYYRAEGAGEEFRFAIPKGGYAVEFEYLAKRFPETSVPAPPRPRLPLWSLGLVALLTLSLVVWSSWPKSSSPVDVVSAPRPLTSYVGSEIHPAISPDAKYTAFSWDGAEANYDIYVAMSSAASALRLTTAPEHDVYPAWSPDGRHVAFLRLSRAETRLMTITSLGGNERLLATLAPGPTFSWKPDAAQITVRVGPSWSPDGKLLAVTDKLSDPGPSLVEIDATSGTKRLLTVPQAGAFDCDPQYSPDGAMIAFLRQSSNSAFDVHVLERNTGRTRQLSFDRRDIRGLSWISSRRIVFSSNRGGDYGLWVADVQASGRLQPLLVSGAKPIQPSVSKTGVLAFAELQQNTNIYRKRLRSADPPERWIASSGRNESPQYAPDGSKIVFVSDRGGSWELWLAGSRGEDPRALTNFGGVMLGTPHWSPDGKHIAFDARPDGHSAVYLIDLDSAASPRLLRRNRFEERMPSWSPDGTWLYFNSNANGSGRLFRVRVDGTGAEPVTSSVAYDSQVRADAIYFLGASTEVWRRQGNEESLLFPGIATRRYFTASERGLYFANNESNRAILFSPWGSKQAAEVARIPGALVVDTPSLSVSPDEKWLLFSQVDRVASDVWTVNLRVP